MSFILKFLVFLNHKESSGRELLILSIAIVYESNF